jgi:tRNA threonylcarbamoyladenosine modification (KEOPS) complex  Pcc1 subunit
MKTEINIDSEEPEKLDKILKPSLNSKGKVNLDTVINKDSFKVVIHTEGLGPLRGTTDNVFRLSSLAKKIIE